MGRRLPQFPLCAARSRDPEGRRRPDHKPPLSQGLQNTAKLNPQTPDTHPGRGGAPSLTSQSTEDPTHRRLRLRTAAQPSPALRTKTPAQKRNISCVCFPIAHALKCTLCSKTEVTSHEGGVTSWLLWKLPSGGVTKTGS